MLAFWEQNITISHKDKTTKRRQLVWPKLLVWIVAYKQYNIPWSLIWPDWVSLLLFVSSGSQCNSSYIIHSKKILLTSNLHFAFFKRQVLMLLFNLLYLADLLLQLSNVSTWAVWWNNQFWGIFLKNIELPLSANLLKGVVHHFEWWRLIHYL